MTNGALRAARILVVEDNPGDARLLFEALRQGPTRDLEIEQVDTLARATQLLHRWNADAVLLDLGLPDSLGFATFEALRAAAPDVAIVVVSGLDDKALANLTVQSGAQDYLVKGHFDPEMLLRVLRYSIERKRIQRELARSEARYRALVENSADGIAMLAASGEVTYASPQVRAILGYEPQEVVGQLVMDFVSPQDRDAIGVLFAASAGAPGEVLKGVGRLKHRDGGTRLLEGAVRNLLGDPAVGGIVVNYRDVTEQRRKEEALRWLHLAVDQSPTAVAMMDDSGRVTYVNDRFVVDTGYSLAAIAAGGIEQLSAVPMSAAEVARRWAGIRAGREFRGDLMHRRRTGEIIWHAVLIAPIRNAAGRATRFLAMLTDITARKGLERELRDANERFEQIAGSVNEIFYVMDAAFRQTMYINAAYERIWGRTCASLYENPWSFLEVVFPDDRPALLDHLARAQGGEEPDPVEFRIESAGEVRWIVNKTFGVRDPRGDVYRISGVARDVTNQRRAREEIEASESRFRMLADTSFDAIDITDAGIVREVNRGFLEIFGYDSEREVVGRPVTDFVAEDYVNMVATAAAANVRGRYDLVGKRKDGRKIVLEVTGVPYPSLGPAARIAAMRDVTEIRSIEAQFRQAQKMEAVGRLASGVAHDFNNLLTVISGNAELLQITLAEREVPSEELVQILAASASAAGLTRQLLAFSRQQVVEPRVLGLNEVVSRMDRMLRRLIGEDVEVTMQLSADDPEVYVDPTQVEQVIANLVVNARDAMPKGGALAIRTAVADVSAGEVLMEWDCPPGRYARLEVADSGQGMSAETLSHIFEPFFTTKEMGKGTGLGLATVYGIVKQARGFIDVESAPDRGTTFRIHFPVADEPVTRGPDPAGKEARGSETILVVEDAADMRHIAAESLRLHGYRVLEAASGVEAIELLSGAAPIDLLVTDVVMPEMSGRVLAERFREMRPGARVLFMTGYTDDAILRDGLSLGAIELITKPFLPGVLAARVREVLDHRDVAIP